MCRTGGINFTEGIKILPGWGGGWVGGGCRAVVSSQLYTLMVAKMIYCRLARDLTIVPESSHAKQSFEECVLSEA